LGTLPPDSPSSHQSVGILLLVLAMAEVLLVFAAVVLLRVVNSISERQSERVVMIGPPAPFRPASEPEAEAIDEAEAAANELPVEPVLVHSYGSTPIGRY
jgi:hypothetical protein